MDDKCSPGDNRVYMRHANTLQQQHSPGVPLALKVTDARPTTPSDLRWGKESSKSALMPCQQSRTNESQQSCKSTCPYARHQQYDDRVQAGDAICVAIASAAISPTLPAPSAIDGCDHAPIPHAPSITTPGHSDLVMALCMWASCVYGARICSSSALSLTDLDSLHELRYAAAYHLATKRPQDYQHHAITGRSLGSWLALVMPTAWDALPGSVEEKLGLLCDGRLVMSHDALGEVCMHLDVSALKQAAVEAVTDQARVLEEAADRQLQLDEASANSLLPAGLLESHSTNSLFPAALLEQPSTTSLLPSASHDPSHTLPTHTRPLEKVTSTCFIPADLLDPVHSASPLNVTNCTTTAALPESHHAVNLAGSTRPGSPHTPQMAEGFHGHSLASAACHMIGHDHTAALSSRESGNGNYRQSDAPLVQRPSHGLPIAGRTLTVSTTQEVAVTPDPATPEGQVMADWTQLDVFRPAGAVLGNVERSWTAPEANTSITTEIEYKLSGALSCATAPRAYDPWRLASPPWLAVNEHASARPHFTTPAARSLQYTPDLLPGEQLQLQRLPHQLQQQSLQSPYQRQQQLHQQPTPHPATAPFSRMAPYAASQDVQQGSTAASDYHCIAPLGLPRVSNSCHDRKSDDVAVTERSTSAEVPVLRRTPDAWQAALALACLSLWWPDNPRMTALSLAIVSVRGDMTTEAQQHRMAAERGSSNGGNGQDSECRYAVSMRFVACELERLHREVLILHQQDGNQQQQQQYQRSEATEATVCSPHGPAVSQPVLAMLRDNCHSPHELIATQPMLALRCSGGEPLLQLRHDLIAKIVLGATGLISGPSQTASELMYGGGASWQATFGFQSGYGGQQRARWPPQIVERELPLQLLHPLAQELLRPVLAILRLERGPVARDRLLTAALRHLAAMAGMPESAVEAVAGSPLPGSTTGTAAVMAGGISRSGINASTGNGRGINGIVSSVDDVSMGGVTERGAAGNGFSGSPDPIPLYRIIQLAELVYKLGVSDSLGMYECALRCAAALHLAASRQGDGSSSVSAAGCASGEGLTCEQLGAALARDQPAAWMAWRRHHPSDIKSQVCALVHGVPGFTVASTLPNSASLYHQHQRHQNHQQQHDLVNHSSQERVVLDLGSLERAATEAAQQRFYATTPTTGLSYVLPTPGLSPGCPMLSPMPIHGVSPHPLSVPHLAAASGYISPHPMHATMLSPTPPAVMQPLRLFEYTAGSSQGATSSIGQAHSASVQLTNVPPPPPPAGPPPRVQALGSPGISTHPHSTATRDGISSLASPIPDPRSPGAVSSVATATTDASHDPPASRNGPAWASAAATRAVVACPAAAPQPAEANTTPSGPARKGVRTEQLMQWANVAFPTGSVAHRAQKAMVQALAEVVDADSPYNAHCRTATDLGQVLAERQPSVWAALTPLSGTKKYRLRPLIDSSPVFMRIKKPPSDCWIKLNVKELAAAAARAPAAGNALRHGSQD